MVVSAIVDAPFGPRHKLRAPKIYEQLTSVVVENGDPATARQISTTFGTANDRRDLNAKQ
jgi:hypothetical protein